MPCGAAVRPREAARAPSRAVRPRAVRPNAHLAAKLSARHASRAQPQWYASRARQHAAPGAEDALRTRAAASAAETTRENCARALVSQGSEQPFTEHRPAPSTQ